MAAGGSLVDPVQECITNTSKHFGCFRKRRGGGSPAFYQADEPGTNDTYVFSSSEKVPGGWQNVKVSGFPYCENGPDSDEEAEMAE